jgi:hypothetical protein
MNRTLRAFTRAIALAGTIASTAAAQTTITQHTTGTEDAFPLFIGQSLTVPGSGSWNSLTFTFFRNGGVASAAGSLYLLTSEYLGSPLALSASTPSFLAKSTSINVGGYTFDPSVTLLGSTQYFFYTDAEILVGGSNVDAYAGGQAYLGNTASYAAFSGDANFKLTGVSTVPEPSTYLLTASGLVVVLGLARRRRRVG